MNNAYPVIPVALIVILAYAVTSGFSRWGMFSKKTHRKFWDTLLLLTFLGAGLLGLLSVIKINYKLEIPQYDNLLKWHVSLGVGMVIIAFFHFLRHLKYYTVMFKKKPSAKVHTEKFASAPDAPKFRYLIFLLGITTIITQVVFIREFISVTSGNELVLGIVMGNWLLITAWGAYTGRRRISAEFNVSRAVNMLSVYTVLPLAMTALLYWLKIMLFPPGTLSDAVTATLGGFILLFPVCFLSGYLFTAFSTLFAGPNKKSRIGRAYALESAGSLAGGLLFSIFLGRIFNSFQVLGLTAGMVFFMGAWLSGLPAKKILFLISGVAIPVFIFSFNPDTRIKKILFPNQEILFNKSTPYGNLLVGRQAGQLNFYENNALQFYTGNLMHNEEAVHFAMLQHANPENVLLISGGISGMAGEIMKYNTREITYLETNPEIYKHWKGLLTDTEESGRIKYVKSDIRTFLNKSGEIYDVILINLPAPSTLGYNRFYTDEFLESVKQHCTSKSVVCTSLPSSANYTGEDALDVNTSLWKTLGKHFKHLCLFTGERNYFLASESQLHSNITELISEKGITNEYVNKYYFDDTLLTQRSQTLVSQFDRPVKINRDFYPYMFIKQTFHWLSRFGTNYYILILLPVVFFLLFFFRLNRISTGLYTGGFTSASLEVTLMLAYQVFFGSIYLATALFFAFFMGGLATGSLWKQKPEKRFLLKRYYILQFIIAAFALLLPVLITLTGQITGFRVFAQLIFFFLVFILAFFIGHEFYLAAEIQPYGVSETTGLNYSTDLVGSAFGAFLTAIVLLPLLGLVTTCLIVAGLNVFSGLMALSAKKSF